MQVSRDPIFLYKKIHLKYHLNKIFDLIIKLVYRILKDFPYYPEDDSFKLVFRYINFHT